MYDGLLGGLVFWTGVRLKESSQGEQSRRARLVDQGKFHHSDREGNDDSTPSRNAIGRELMTSMLVNIRCSTDASPLCAGTVSWVGM